MEVKGQLVGVHSFPYGVLEIVLAGDRTRGGSYSQGDRTCGGSYSTGDRTHGGLYSWGIVLTGDCTHPGRCLFASGSDRLLVTCRHVQGVLGR